MSRRNQEPEVPQLNQQLPPNPFESVNDGWGNTPNSTPSYGGGFGAVDQAPSHPWGDPQPRAFGQSPANADGGFGSFGKSHSDDPWGSQPNSFSNPASTFGLESDYGYGFTPTPYNALQHPVEAKNHHGRNLVIGGVLAGAAILGAGGTAYALHNSGDTTASSTIGNQQTPPAGPDANLSANSVMSISATPEASDPGPSPELVQKFQTIISGDTCTPITAEAAAKTYHEIFEVDKYKNMSQDELLQATDSAITNFNQVRSKLDFQALPTNFAALEADSEGNPTIPISVYQMAIKTELAGLGIDSKFTWEPAASDYEADAKGVPRPHAGHDKESLQTPLTDAQWNDPGTRRGLVQFMKDIAAAPKRFVENGKLPVVFFTSTPGYGGTTASMQDGPARMMTLDPTAMTTAGNFNHEDAHATQYMFCAALTDPAWDNANPKGFVYKDDLPKGQAPNPAFTDEGSKVGGNSNGKIVTTTEYGTTNQKENYAETIGQELLNASAVDTLYAAPDAEIPFEQIALFTERVRATDPEMADYFEGLMSIGQLEAALKEKRSALGKEFNDKYFKPAYDANSKGTMTPDQQQLLWGDGPKEGTEAYDLQEQTNAVQAAIDKIDFAKVPIK